MQNSNIVITTPHLILIPATIELLKADLAGVDEFASKLECFVPDSWPPELLTKNVLNFALNLLESNLEEFGWWLYYFVLKKGFNQNNTLIGGGGYKGKPKDGVVEIGYSILPQFRRKGYASEVTLGLVDNAFNKKEVRRVVAETFPYLVPSIGVLENCGFCCMGKGSEKDVIRYEITKEDYLKKEKGKGLWTNSD